MTFVLDISILGSETITLFRNIGKQNPVRQRCIPEQTQHGSNYTADHLLNLYTNTMQHIPTVHDYNNYIRCRNGDGLATIQGVTGGTDQTSGACSLGHTIPI